MGSSVVEVFRLKMVLGLVIPAIQRVVIVRGGGGGGGGVGGGDVGGGDGMAGDEEEVATGVVWFVVAVVFCFGGGDGVG